MKIIILDVKGHKNLYSYIYIYNFKILIRKKDGYINISKFIKNYSINNVNFKDWCHISYNKKYIENLKNILNYNNISDIINPYKKKLPNIIKGTYVHPYILCEVGDWILNDFKSTFLLWIYNWKIFSKENNIIHYNKLNDINTSIKLFKDKKIQIKLYKIYKKIKQNPKINILTKYGYIDLITDKYIIEIMKYDKFKISLSNILCYGYLYPNKHKIVYLYNHNKNNIDEIIEICNLYDIEVIIR